MIMGKRVVKMTGWRMRKHRVRKKISGTTERPRLNVYRSNRHIYAQLIDDSASATLAAASTMEKDASGGDASLKKLEAARLVGERLARQALEKGIECAVFDRGGYIYHGRIKALAEGAREAGLKF